eukprot:15482683-Alexandrium_andersonii.AAC.1
MALRGPQHPGPRSKVARQRSMDGPVAEPCAWPNDARPEWSESASWKSDARQRPRASAGPWLRRRAVGEWPLPAGRNYFCNQQMA